MLGTSGYIPKYLIYTKTIGVAKASLMCDGHNVHKKCKQAVEATNYARKHQMSNNNNSKIEKKHAFVEGKTSKYYKYS